MSEKYRKECTHAYRGQHQVNKQEELLTGGGEEVGEMVELVRLSAIRDRRQAAMALLTDVDDTGSGSLLVSILSTFLEK